MQYAPLFVLLFVKGLNATFKYFERKLSNDLSAKISFSFLSIYEKNVTCKRDPEVRDLDETEMFDFQSETRPRPRRWENESRDRLETETSRPRLHPCRHV